MAKIRLLRLLEYEYSSEEAMINDLGRWQVPQNGIKFANSHTTIRSACLPVSIINEAVDGERNKEE